MVHERALWRASHSYVIWHVMPSRRFRTRESYRRRGPTREPYDAVLLVCEGGKTEPHYFEGLKVAYRLSSANVAIRPMGQDPLSLVNYAIAELERDKTLTRAYCVFDRDEHATFGDALRKAHDCAQGQIGRLRAAVSIPCFEVWPLLHFGLTDKPIVAGGGKTPGQQALSLIQAAMPEYSKSDRSIFEMLAPRLADAVQNAERLAASNRKTGSENPGTDIHDLVSYLIALKR